MLLFQINALRRDRHIFEQYNLMKRNYQHYYSLVQQHVKEYCIRVCSSHVDVFSVLHKYQETINQ